MAPKRNNKDTIDNQESEQSAVDWLRKIYEKMEEIQTEQSKFNKYVENNFNTLFSEIEKIKSKQCNTLICDINKESSEVKLDIEGYVHERKHAYYKQIQSKGISTIYKSFIERDIPFIPKKFREGHIPGESAAQTERIRKLEKTKVSLECERLDEEAEKNEQKIKKIEQEVAEKIQSYKSPEYRQELKKKWISTTSREETKSEEIWETKKTFFEKLPNEDTTVQSKAKKRAPQRNNNNTQYHAHRGVYYNRGNVHPRSQIKYSNASYNNGYYEKGRNDQFFRERRPQQSWGYYRSQNY